MKITTVTYAKLVNLGNYSNEKLSVTAEVSEDDAPDVVIDALRLRVESTLDAWQADREAALERENIASRRREAEQELALCSSELAKVPEDADSATYWRARKDYLERRLADPKVPYTLDSDRDNATDLPF